MRISKRTYYCHTLYVVSLLVSNIYGDAYHYVPVTGMDGHPNVTKCDNKKTFCLDSNNGASPTCYNGNCICFHYDQDFDSTPSINNCQIIDGGYCSTNKFGDSGRPDTACKEGSSCIKTDQLNFYRGNDAEDIGICCPNNECQEFLETITLPERGSPCHYDNYKKEISLNALIDKHGNLFMNNSDVDEYVNRMLWKVRKENSSHLVNHCFHPHMNAPKGSTPLFELRCNPTNKCDCGYSQVYKSLKDEDREYYDSEGKWVVDGEPAAQPMVYDSKVGKCRLPVGSNCTNYDGCRKPIKDFESCSSELKCCRKSYYDDREIVKKDIIGYCAPSCPSLTTFLQCCFKTIISSFVIINFVNISIINIGL